MRIPLSSVRVALTSRLGLILPTEVAREFNTPKVIFEYPNRVRITNAGSRSYSQVPNRNGMDEVALSIDLRDVVGELPEKFTSTRAIDVKRGEGYFIIQLPDHRAPPMKRRYKKPSLTKSEKPKNTISMDSKTDYERDPLGYQVSPCVIGNTPTISTVPKSVFPSKLTLPEPMSVRSAVKFLNERREENKPDFEFSITEEGKLQVIVCYE